MSRSPSIMVQSFCTACGAFSVGHCTSPIFQLLISTIMEDTLKSDSSYIPGPYNISVVVTVVTSVSMFIAVL